MSTHTETKADFAANVVTKERLFGKASRWRRHGEPTLAGSADGVEYGVFGPGSVAWDVILHPATMVFQSAAQFILQLSYKPVFAGVRDHDTISRKAREGTLNLFDIFDREQRNSGIHVPMWIGDTDTAKRVSGHLIRVHDKVAGPTIDVGDPELGGYAANSPRESMWATWTEMHSMLRAYEALAFRGFWLPRRLPQHKRDQYIAEFKAYTRLFPYNEADLPNTTADLKKLYKRDAQLFGASETITILPETKQNFATISEESIRKNYHPSQNKVKFQLFLQDKLLRFIALSALPSIARRNFGVSRRKEKVIVISRYLLLPLIWLLQQGPIERYFMRLMWGPDAVKLITAARVLHKKAKKARQTSGQG